MSKRAGAALIDTLMPTSVPIDGSLFCGDTFRGNVLAPTWDECHALTNTILEKEALNY